MQGESDGWEFTCFDNMLFLWKNNIMFEAIIVMF